MSELIRAASQILEYTMHRFLFHIDEHLPDHPAALTLHFLLHGIHHYIPVRPLRLSGSRAQAHSLVLCRRWTACAS